MKVKRDMYEEPGKFVLSLKSVLEQGYSITPFLGSGVSAPSGIIMGQEFDDYLTHVVKSVLKDGWNIMKNGWPARPSQSQIKSSKCWILEEYTKCLKKPYDCEPVIDADLGKIISIKPINGAASDLAQMELKRPLVPRAIRTKECSKSEDQLDENRRSLGIDDSPSDPNQSVSSPGFIYDTAFRALAFWTKTLEFLATVRVGSGGSGIWMGELDDSIIDSFNMHITRGRNPNLIHNMMARLSRSFRTRVILSTNFDTLVEQSYRAQGEPLHVLAVSTKGGLPSYATVRSQDSLVKLHGDLLETRADTSIDEPPSESDKRRFFQYLHGPSEPHEKGSRDVAPSHLLVVGYSAGDARCVQMIKYVLDFKKNFRVFWIGYSQSDVDRIKDVFSDYPDKMTITRTDRADLLLWELYQSTNLALPGGGHNFQFSHNVPPQPKRDEAPLKSDIFDRIYKAGSIKKSDDVAKIVWIDGSIGVAEPLSQVFTKFVDWGIKSVWLELEDFATPQNLLTGIISSIAMKLGDFQLEWFCFPPKVGDEKESDESLTQRLRLFVEKYGISPNDWGFFLYGRNGPGGCCGWTVSYWEKKEYVELARICKVMSDFGFRIIYMAHGEKRDQRNVEKIRMISEHAYSHFPQPEQQAKPKADASDPEVEFQKHYRAWSAQAWASILKKDGTNSYWNAVRPRPGYSEIRENPIHIPAYDSMIESNLVKESFPDLYESIDASELAPPGSRPSYRGFQSKIEQVMKEFSISGEEMDWGKGDKAAQQAIRVKASRMLWLYGVTLFRQSRHSAALICEAIFPCPFKFRYQKDNDEIRNLFLFGLPEDRDRAEYTELEKEYADLFDPSKDPTFDFFLPERIGWVNWLRDQKLLLRKPGGYAWKYRDTRLGLQYLLEQSPYFKLYNDGLGWENPKGGKPYFSESTDRDVSRVWRLRGRTHYWIADWYLRAYHSTLHHIPLVEAIYHSVQALTHAPYFTHIHDSKSDFDMTPDEKIALGKASAARLAWRSICLIRKLIHSGERSLLFWMPGADLWKLHFRGFEPPGSKNPISDSIEKIRARLWETIEPEDDFPLKKRIDHGLDALTSELEQLCANVQAEGQPHGVKSGPMLIADNQILRPAKERSLKIFHDADIINDDEKWLSAGIKKALKQINYDHRISGKNPKSFFDLQKIEQVADVEDFIKFFRRFWLKEWGTANYDTSKGGILREACDEKKLVDLIWVLGQAAYRIVRRAKLVRYSSDTNADEQQERLWGTACGVCYLALQLTRHLSPQFYRFDCQLRIELLTIYGISLGYLGRFKESHRRVNEAHALLVSGLQSTERKEQAKIQLRRAEITLTEAGFLMDGLRLPKAKLDAEKKSSKRMRKITKLELLPVIARVDEAWAAIERANLSMTGTNHSCFWWFRLTSLKLKTYAFVAKNHETILRKSKRTEKFKRPLCLPFRQRLHYPTILVELLRDCLILGDGDEMRELRSVLHFFEAVRLERHRSEDDLKAGRGIHGMLRRPSEGESGERKPELLLEGAEDDGSDVEAINIRLRRIWNPKEKLKGALEKQFELIKSRLEEILGDVEKIVNESNP